MTRRRLTFAGLSALVFLLVFFQRGMIKSLLAVPLVNLWRQLKLYYAEISQPVLWIALIAWIGISALITILSALQFEEKDKMKVKTTLGQIEELTNLIQEARQGPYFDKWLIANRLGENAQEILAQREGRPVSRTFGTLCGIDWNPPPEIAIYLNTGLQSSLIGRADRRWSMRGRQLPPTSLDIDLQQVIDYLENEMKI